MVKLCSLLERVDYALINGNTDIEIENISYDSRTAQRGDVLVCIKGIDSDGHEYIQEGLEKGIKALIVEKDIDYPKDITVLKVENSRIALAEMSAAYFGHPAEKLKTIGVTGTKGKTTTTYMIKELLEKAGYKVGLIGTIEISIGSLEIEAENTTPESYVVQKYFRKMVDAGCNMVVMEVSSQGLMLNRVSGFIFDYGIFTNIESDHIGPNEHKDFDDYLRCKSLLFKQCKTGILNGDDPYVERILEGVNCDAVTFGIYKDVDVSAKNIALFNEKGIMGVEYDLTGKRKMHIIVDVPGEFSVYNSLGAICLALEFCIKEEDIISVMREMKIRGRVELVPVSDDFTVMVDYAHNAMALKNLLLSLKKYKPKRLVCVFGCGGNRDRNRRFEMGKVAADLADFTIVTSDNPRKENPEKIIDDILIGINRSETQNPNYVVIPSRNEAIIYAINNGILGDVIIIAGKGHENYQIIGNKKIHFDDREIILKLEHKEK